jgi:hypothetical protein
MFSSFVYFFLCLSSSLSHLFAFSSDSIILSFFSFYSSVPRHSFFSSSSSSVSWFTKSCSQCQKGLGQVARTAVAANSMGGLIFHRGNVFRYLAQNGSAGTHPVGAKRPQCEVDSSHLESLEVPHPCPCAISWRDA